MKTHPKTPLNAKVALSLTLVSSALISAQTTYAQDESETLDDLQVWGTEVKASSVRLEDDTLAIRQADHISDLLRTIPGVDVGGAHSLNQRITIRSMDDKDLNISIDGARQNSYMYHHMGNLQIHADILQAVDISIGSNSVIDGGIGGAVRFETKSARQLLQKDQRFGGRLQASYGDNSGSSLAFTGFGQLTEQLDMLAYFNSVQRDNYKVGGDKIKDFSGNEIEGTNGEVKGLDGDVKDALLKLGWDINESQRLEFGFETYSDEGDYSYRPDMGLATDLAITNSLGIPLLWPTEFTRDTVTLNYELDWGGHSYLKAAVFSNTSELSRDETGWAENENFADFAGNVDGEAKNTGLNLLAETSLGKQTLTYGVEFNQYDTAYSAKYTNGSSESSEENADSIALYVQDQIAINEQFSVIPGIRFDQHKVDSTVVDDTFDKVTGALAAEYAINNVTIRAGATQLFKAPEIGEVFIGAGLFDTANADIEAETGINKELAIAYENQALGADRFATGVTFFQTDLNDYIYDYATPPEGVQARSWKDNVGDMQVEGFEAYIAYDLGNLSTLLTFSRADSELDAFDQYADLDGARLDRKQGDTISLNIDYALAQQHVTLHWDTLYVDDLDSGVDLDGASADNAKDGFTVHNVSARWSPQQVKGLALTVGVDNLFDEFYASQSSRTGLSLHPRFGELYLQDYEPGRNVKITASYDF